MGEVTITVLVGGREEFEERIEEIDIVVDTGALHSMLPTSLLEYLGVAPEWKQPFVLGDDSQVELPVGHVTFYIHDMGRYCPVIFGSDQSYLLGATTLENFSLGVDPVNQDVVPVTHRVRPI